MPLGDSILQEKDFPTHSICEILKILGIYFGYEDRQRNNLKFSQALKKYKGINQCMEMERALPFRRIQIVKTFAIPKFMFGASVILASKELIKEANSVLYNFIWNGNDKVKRLALISDIEMGGLKMLDIQSMICAKRIICFVFVLHCNFQTSKLKINLPAFYKDCFDAWSEVNGKRLQVFTRTLLMKLS